MVTGFIHRYADSSQLDGCAFDFIEPLRNLSSESFQYPLEHPLHNVMDDVSPFELVQLIDLVIKKHRKQIRKLKAMEVNCQKLESFCMVEQAYMAGAREMFLGGKEAGIVPLELENVVRERLRSRWVAMWRLIAGGVADALLKIRVNVELKGKKSKPKVLRDIHSPIGIRDEAVLLDIHKRAPKDLLLSSDEYAAHMKEGIVPEIKVWIRGGKLSGGSDPYDYQIAVDQHARRLRRRLDAHLLEFRERGQKK